MKKLLLVSNGKNHDQEFLAHCKQEMLEMMGDVKELLFIPYSSHPNGYAGYVAKMREIFADSGIVITGIHEGDPKTLLSEAKAVFVGGGNTFRLLKTMYDQDLLEIMRERALTGELIYMGASAGINIACPSMKTTNDMPIVEPKSLTAMSLVLFNINPHYIDADPNSSHMGETREKRIAEYHEENDNPVIGLREGGMLRVLGDKIELIGPKGAKLFKKGAEAIELPIGEVSEYFV